MEEKSMKRGHSGRGVEKCQQQKSQPFKLEATPLTLFATSWPEKKKPDISKKNDEIKPAKGSDMVVDKENTCLRMDKQLKTHRFPFCRETGVTTEDMRKPHQTSLGVIPMRDSSAFGIRVVLEGQPPPTITQPPPTARVNTPEAEFKSARLPWTHIPLMNPQLPAVKPCILPSIGTSQKITLKPRQDSTMVKQTKHGNQHRKLLTPDFTVAKKSSQKVEDLDAKENDERKSRASSITSVQSLVEEAKQIALNVDRQHPKKCQRLSSAGSRHCLPPVGVTKCENNELTIRDGKPDEDFDADGQFTKRQSKRTVDEIIVSLRQSRQKKFKRLSSADRKIREIMQGVVMQTRAVLGNIVTPLTEDWDAFERSGNFEIEDMEEEKDYDEMEEAEESDGSSMLCSARDDLPMDQETLELDSMAITPGEAQLIQETLAAISEYSYQDPDEDAEPLAGDNLQEAPLGPMQGSPSEATLLQQAWRGLFSLDDLCAVGRSCLDLSKQSSVSLLNSWQMNKRTNSSAADHCGALDGLKRNVDGKKSSKTVHHFCMMRHNVLLPDPYKGAWSRYHIHNKYRLPSKSQEMTAVTVKGTDTEGSDLYQHQLKASQRILDETTQHLKDSLKRRSDDRKVLSDAGERNNSSQQEVNLKGTKVKIMKDSMIYWTPAPPKWDVAPAKVKEVLFPDYHGSEYTLTNPPAIKKLKVEPRRSEVTSSSYALEQQQEPQEQFQRSFLHKRFGSSDNLRSFTLNGDMQLKDPLEDNSDLAENYRQYNEWRVRQLDEPDERYNPHDKKILKRCHSTPDNLDKDDDFLVIYQDFTSVMKELTQQKHQMLGTEDDDDVTDIQSAIESKSTDNIMVPNEESPPASVLQTPSPLQTSRLTVTARSGEMESHVETSSKMRKDGPVRRHSKRRKSSVRRTCDSVLAEYVMRSLKNRQPELLTRSDSMPNLAKGLSREFKVSVKAQKVKWTSIPCLLNFEVYKAAHKWESGSNEREWVRDIWTQWFNEVFPPTPIHLVSASDVNYQSSADAYSLVKSANKTNRDVAELKIYEPESVALFPVIDEDLLNSGDVKLLEEEVKRLTSTINRDSVMTNSYDLCRRGAILRRLGKIKLALDDLNEAIDVEPHLLDAYWHRHLILALLNRKQLAIEDLDFILRQNKMHVAAYKSRAMLLRDMGDLTMSVFNLTQALKYNPNDVDALFQRAEIYETTGDMLLAMDDYASCRQINPALTKASLKHGLYYFQNCVWHSAIEDFSQVLTFEPGNAEVRLLRSRAYMQMKMWNEALEDVSIAIHMDPLNSQAFYYRGCILRKVHPRRALQDYSISLMLNNGFENILSYLHRGILYNDIGQSDAAMADFEAVLKLDPCFASAYVNLGLIYLKSNKSTAKHRAIELFTCAIKADPTLIKAYMCRAETYEKLTDYKRALLDVTRAIHLRPDMSQLYMWRGDLAHKLGQVELATFCLSQMSEMNIVGGEHPIQQALMQSFLKNYDKAIDVLREATSGNGATVRLLTLRGETQMKASLWNDAIVSFESAIQLMLQRQSDKDPQNLKGKRKPSPELSDAYYLIGVCHMEQCGFLLALDAFSNAIKTNPKHAEAFYWRGFAKLKLNHPKGILDINSSLALDPTQFQAFLTRAAYFGLQGKHSKAILNCNEAINLQPNCIRAFLYRGALKFFMKSYVLAIRDLTKAISIDSTCALAFFNRAVCHHANHNQQKALQDYGVVLLLTDETLHAKAVINRSLLYIEMKDYCSALYDLLMAAELSPFDKKIYHTLGICHYKLGFLKESVGCFTKALELDHFFQDALIGRGNAFMDFGHETGYTYAKRDYERVLHIDPLCLPARVNLAYCLQVTGKFMQAWHQFTAAIAIDSNFVPALEGRAVINLQMSDTFAAYQDISASIRVHPTAELLTNRGVIHQFMNDKVNSMRDYQRAIKLDPTYALAYFNAANIYFHSHQFSQALAYYNLAIANNGEDESAFLNRAITHVMLKDATSALKDFDMACKFSPYSAHIYFNRANLYMSLQMYAKAEKDYSQALSLQPDDPLMLMRRGDALSLLQQPEAASQDYRMAIQLADQEQ